MSVAKNLTPVVETLPLSRREEAELKRKAMRDKDREMVKGIFKDFECPGGQLSFSFKKYKEDPIETFTMVDGGIYTVPLGVAKHLNMNCHYPIHSYTVDAEGKPVQKVSEKVHRYGFSSLEFAGVDDYNPAGKSIITVENLAR